MDINNKRKIRIGTLILAAVLATTLLVFPRLSSPSTGYAYTAPKFRAAAGAPSLSTVYIKKGSSISIKGYFLAKGDKVNKYKSSKTSIATISSKGKLKARKTGKTTVTLTTKKGKKDSIKIVVTSKSTPAKSIKISAKKTINAKQSVRPTVKVSPSKSTSTIKWYSYNKKIATVNAAGYITGKKAGTAKIRAKTSNGKVAYCIVTVKDPVSISRKTASVRVDRPGALTLTASAPSGTVVWSSSDSSVATVKSGVVTPKKIGIVDIIAKSKASGTTASCRVTVVPHIPASGISVSPDEDTIFATKTMKIKATLVSAVAGKASNDDIKWSTSSAKIAKVSSAGMVTGVGYGTATITATAESGPSASAKITVSTVDAKLSRVIITPGMSYKASFAFYGSGSSSGVKYSSSDSSIARVTSSGTVYANLRNKETGVAKSGTVTITAKAKSGDKDTMKVVVSDEPTIIDVSKWQGDINWATASKSVDLAILRVLHGTDISLEPKYKTYADNCKKYDLPFGVYAYVTYKSKSAAESQAKKFYDQAVSGGRAPLFFIVDAEEDYITRANTEAYIAKLRSLAKADGIGRLKVGVYVGHHLYKKLNLNLTTSKSNAKTPDFVWIPRYNSNIGARTSSMDIPDFTCDIWQYTSTGRIPGIDGNVDVNTLTTPAGDKLTKKSTFNFDWLIKGSDVG